MRSSPRCPPGCASLPPFPLGGEAGVSPLCFISLNLIIIISNKWNSTASDMQTDTNYAQRKRPAAIKPQAFGCRGRVSLWGHVHTTFKNRLLFLSLHRVSTLDPSFHKVPVLIPNPSIKQKLSAYGAGVTPSSQDHLALLSAESQAESVRVCVRLFVLEEGWFRGSGLGI